MVYKDTGKRLKYHSETQGLVYLEVLRQGIKYRLRFPNTQYFLNMGFGSCDLDAQKIKKWFGMEV